MRNVTTQELIVGDRTGSVFELPSGRLVCVSYSGCVVTTSDNGGDSWTTRTSSLHANANPRTFFVDSNDNLYFSKGLAGQSGRLYRSTDDGETWSMVLDTAVINPGQYSNALWFMCEQPNGHLYINEYSFANSPTEGWQALHVFKSIDSGLTWQTFYTHPNEIRHLHKVSCDSAGQLFVSGAHGIVGGQPDPAFTAKLNNDGTLGQVLQPQGIGGGMTGFVQADDGGLLFASDRLNGIWKLSGDGITLYNTLDFADFGVVNDNLLDIIKGRDGVIYTVSSNSTRAYIFASDDDGNTWTLLEYPSNVGPASCTSIVVGRGPTPYIYWDGGVTNNYRRMKDYSRAELRALYTSTLTITTS